MPQPQDFNAFHAQAVERALAQPAGPDGQPPVVTVTRHSLMLGDVSIPVFGNYHSRESDIREGRQLLAEWLKKNLWAVPCDEEALPVIWGRFASEGQHRIVDWSVVRDGQAQETPLINREDAEYRVAVLLDELGVKSRRPDTSFFVSFPEDIPRTETIYGHHGGAPVAVACRGRYPLGHQCQQIRRDLFAERLNRGEYQQHGLRMTETDAEFRERNNTPYRYLVQGYGGTAGAAFRTREGLDSWLEAYGLGLNEVTGAITFDVAPMQELTWVPAPEQGFLPEALPAAEPEADVEADQSPSP